MTEENKDTKKTEEKPDEAKPEEIKGDKVLNPKGEEIAKISDEVKELPKSIPKSIPNEIPKNIPKDEGIKGWQFAVVVIVVLVFSAGAILIYDKDLRDKVVSFLKSRFERSDN